MCGTHGNVANTVNSFPHLILLFFGWRMSGIIVFFSPLQSVSYNRVHVETITKIYYL